MSRPTISDEAKPMFIKILKGLGEGVRLVLEDGELTYEDLEWLEETK